MTAREKSPVATRKKLRLLQLAAVMFLTISGGPYGLESLLGYVGNNGVFLLLIITPLLWDIPTIFTVLELNSMMPVEGGYYQWVKRGLGLRFAWYEGWWTWLYTFVDLAIYPVLFVEYLSFFWPEAHAYKIPICLAIIWSCALLNIRGIVPVGRVSLLLGVIVLTPFICLFVYFMLNHTGPVSFPSPSLKGIELPALGLGIYTVMWNFLGWDNVTTYADEVSRPVRTYLLSAVLAFLLIFGIYFITMLIAVNSGIDHAKLGEEGFPSLGSLIGGPVLGAVIAFGGMAGGLGLYTAVLLSVSRIPKVMADDQLLPGKMNKLHPKFGTPYLSIITCSLLVSIMIMLTFADLLIIDVMLYGAALFLEFITLIVLRKKLPNEPRPFKIPLGIPGLCLMMLLPVGVYSIALIGAFSDSGGAALPVVYALLALLSAEVGWWIILWLRPHLKNK
ncbi:MAG: family permease [Bacteroidota bacterium]|jgi:amino acid transporter|nr:family permease [Bacteroidota bacterium]